MSRSVSMAQTIGRDGAMGAAVGLLGACAYVGMDLRQMAAGGAPLESLGGLIVYAGAQGALLAGLGGAALRRIVAAD